MTYFYGPNPFKWTWGSQSPGKKDLNIKHGEFCYYQNICSKLVLFIVTRETAGVKDSSFTYNGNVFILKEKKSIHNKNQTTLLPVLGYEIALPTNTLATLPRSLFSSSSYHQPFNFKKTNETILKQKYPKLDFSHTKIKLKCLFHDDVHPSALYNTETGFYKCFACNKVCKNLKKHL